MNDRDPQPDISIALAKHVHICAGCGIYADAVNNPEQVLASLAPVPLPIYLSSWGWHDLQQLLT